MQLFKMIVHNTVSSVNIETAVLFFLYVPSTQNSAWHILGSQIFITWMNKWLNAYEDCEATPKVFLIWY